MRRKSRHDRTEPNRLDRKTDRTVNMSVCVWDLVVCPLCACSGDSFIMLGAEMARLKISHKPVHPQPRPVHWINSPALLWIAPPSR